MRGDAAVLEAAPGPLADGLAGLRSIVELLDDDVAERVIVDLGRFPRLGYYTGAMFEVYDPGLGEPLGGGGRYDDLLGRFGRPLPGGRASRSASTGCTSPSPARSAGRRTGEPASA